MLGECNTQSELDIVGRGTCSYIKKEELSCACNFTLYFEDLNFYLYLRMLVKAAKAKK